MSKSTYSMSNQQTQSAAPKLTVISRNCINRCFVTKGNNLMCEISGYNGEVIIQKNTFNKIQADGVVFGVIQEDSVAPGVHLFKTLKF